MSISIGNAGAVQSLATAEPVRETPKPQKPEEAQDRPLKPEADEYVPAETPKPSGRYWLGKDENSQPKIFFDNPEQTKEARCTGDTSKVDREIEKLKQMQRELEQQLNSETDETKIKDLEKKLAQVTSKLREKDNDTYRRQHTHFS